MSENGGDVTEAAVLRDPWDCPHDRTRTVTTDHECARPHCDCGPGGPDSHEERICEVCGATLEVL